MMKETKNSITRFIDSSLRSSSEWLFRQLNSGLVPQFSDFWEKWQNHQQYFGAGSPLSHDKISISLTKCIDILSKRFAERPVTGRLSDSIAIWDRESFCDLLSQVGINQKQIQTVCQKLDSDTVMVWQAREIMERQKVPEVVDDPYLRGTAPAFVEARELLYRVSPTDIPVLLCGETGTGKEVFARNLHRLSSRSAGSFIALNSGAFPESTLESELFGYGPGAFTGALREGYKGKLAAAEGGTLFLDEVTELPHRVQIALLRFLETGEVQTLARSSPGRYNVRLVFASQFEPESLLESGKLRMDFYYRISVFPIIVPPLRNRLEDIPVIVQNILKDVVESRNLKPKHLSNKAIDLLKHHSWKGNIRELKNLLERASLLAKGPNIEVEHLEKLKIKNGNYHSVNRKWLTKLQTISPELLPSVSLSNLAEFLERFQEQGIQNRNYSVTFQISESTARRHLAILCEAGILRRTGDKKGSKYFCTP
jgi:transcriptional regulator with PAS, ATPase and Fis domain